MYPFSSRKRYRGQDVLFGAKKLETGWEDNGILFNAMVIFLMRWKLKERIFWEVFLEGAYWRENNEAIVPSPRFSQPANVSAKFLIISVRENVTAHVGVKTYKERVSARYVLSFFTKKLAKYTPSVQFAFVVLYCWPKYSLTFNLSTAAWRNLQ